MNFFIAKQLPILHPERYQERLSNGETLADIIAPKVLELTYTAWDLKPFAEDCGYHGPPFAWNPERRAQLRAELDAIYAHLYGLSRDEFAYILDTFPIVCEHDEKRFGEYRTKRMCLEEYDRYNEMFASKVVSIEKHAKKQAPPEFHQAVIIAWIVREHAQKKVLVTRFRTQKSLYLLCAKFPDMSEGLDLEYKRKAAGPYDPSIRYKGGEPIAAKNEYIKISGTVFKPGPNINKIDKYLPSYIPDITKASEVLEMLSHIKDEDTLGRTATVHYSAMALKEAGHQVTVDTIINYIGNDPEWKHKLKEPSFRPEFIQNSLEGLQRLGFLKLD